MAVPPEKQQDDDDEFTFPTPQFLAGARDKDRHQRVFHHLPCSSSSPPVWLHLSSPIRRSFSAADCAASPWRDRLPLSRCCSPALSAYTAGGFCDGEEEEEERMDSLWEDLNDEDAAGDDLFLDVSRRRSVGGADVAARASKERERAAALGASRSSRRRPPGLVAMMRGLKKMFVAHKDKSRVHRDEQSIASASPCKKR